VCLSRRHPAAPIDCCVDWTYNYAISEQGIVLFDKAAVLFRGLGRTIAIVERIYERYALDWELGTRRWGPTRISTAGVSGK
jgi:hypothetical protein